MKRQAPLIVWFTILAGLSACAPDEPPEAPVKGRWYTHEQVSRGKPLFAQHCAVCHGEFGQGLAEDWRKTDANGNYPPPPLNGTAHTWHHPTEVLLGTIQNGGVPLGGVMPPFAAVLDEDQSLDVIAYIQSLWTDVVYARWLEIDRR